MTFKDIESIKYQSRGLYKIKIYGNTWTNASLVNDALYFFFKDEDLYTGTKQNSPHIINLPQN